MLDNNKQTASSADTSSALFSWYHSLVSTAMLGLNIFAIPAALLSYFDIWNYLHLSFLEHLGFSSDVFIISAIGGILVGGISALLHFIYDKKIAPKKLTKNPANKDDDAINPEPWNRRLESGVNIGQQFGSFIGFTIAAMTLSAIPLAGHLPLFNLFVNAIVSAIGGIIGGFIGLALGPLLTWLDKRLIHFSFYQQFVDMVNSQNTENLPVDRIKYGLQFGSYAGVIIGAIAGTVFPGLGTVIGMGIGGAVGGILGSIAGLVSEPVLRRLRDEQELPLPTSNPWTTRISAGITFGVCAGLILNTVMPGLGLLLGSAIGAVAGGALCLALEPLYLRLMTRIYGTAHLRQSEPLLDKNTISWTTRMSLGSMAGAGIGCLIGLAAGGPAGLLVGAGIGGIVGGISGCCLIAPLQIKLKNIIAPLFSKLLGYSKTTPTPAETTSKPPLPEEAAIAKQNKTAVVTELEEKRSTVQTTLAPAINSTSYIEKTANHAEQKAVNEEVYSQAKAKRRRSLHPSGFLNHSARALMDVF